MLRWDRSSLRDALGPGAGFFPFWLGTLGVVLSLALFVQSWRGRAIGEGTQAPAVTVLVNGGDTIGEIARPSTYAPTPRPGPVMSIDIPRLKLHSGVVPIAWEPPRGYGQPTT